MLTAFQFHARRKLARLRRAWHRVQSCGWSATWARALQHARAVAPRAVSAAPACVPVAAAAAGWVLVVDVAAPRPDRDSGSLRLYNLIRLLLRARYRVSFIADDGHAAGADGQALQHLGVDLVRLSAVDWMRAHGSRLDAVILCRHHVAAAWLPLARALAPAARVIFDTVDLHFLREQREAHFRGSARLERRARATQAIELRLVARADTTWVVSEVEQALVRGQVANADVQVLSNIIDSVVPGGDYMSRHDLLFVGGHQHPPNADAVRWLLSDVFPRLRARLPQLRLHLVGADAPPALVAAAAAQPGVTLHGHVPDLEPYLSGCRIAIAPLRFGAGVKGKINLSMAHGQPVVATSCAVEGMHLRPGRDVLVADDVDGIVDAVVRLHEQRDLWQLLAGNGMENVRRHFSFDVAAAVLARTLAAVPADAGGHGRG